jgi:hypothetical protein
MRPNQNKRIRGRSNNNGSNRRGPNPLTRSYESNGPDVKVRGTAAHVAEKYVQLARDAHVAGDPVAVENYLQHAEHYYRIIATAQALQTAQQQQSQGLPVTVEIDDADEDDFDNAMSDRFTFRTPQSFQPNDPTNPANQQNGPPQPNLPREGERLDQPQREPRDQQREPRMDQQREPRRFEPRDRQDFARNENRNENRNDGRNDRPNDRGDRQDYRRNERPAYNGDQPGYAPDQGQVDPTENREGAPAAEGGDRQPRNNNNPTNDRFNRRDRFRNRQPGDPRFERTDRPERQDRPERTDRPESTDRPARTDRFERTERAERSLPDAASDADVGLPSFITQPKRVVSDVPTEAPTVVAVAPAEAAPKKRGRRPKVVAGEDVAVED